MPRPLTVLSRFCAGSLLFLAPICASSAAWGQEGGAASPSPELPPELSAHSWREVLARDGRLSFPAVNPAALEALEAPAEGPRPQLGAALMALGSSHEKEAARILAGWVSEGRGETRLAAILALGELGEGLGEADLTLVDLLTNEEPEVAECALLALLRSGAGGWRELAQGIAEDASHPLQAAAGQLLAFSEDPASQLPPPPAAARLLGLRWQAARHFGFIDGRPWAATLLERLARSDRFLDQVILEASGELHHLGVADQVLSLLLEPGDPLRVRVAVRVMPREVEKLVSAGLWQPASAAEWRALIDEAYHQGVVPLLPDTFEKAGRRRAVAPLAAATLMRRQEGYAEIISATLDGEDAQRCAETCRALGHAGAQTFLNRLARLGRAQDPRVRAAALVARLELGDSDAYDATRALLLTTEEAQAEDRRALLDALELAGRSGDLTAFLADLTEELEGLSRADLTAICALRGRGIDGELLREEFSLCDPGSSTARRLVRALGALPSEGDLDFLADIFPVDGQFELNVALARALVRGGHKKIEPILRAAVWRGPFARSMLAAGVVREAFGLQTLLHWVLSPPAQASRADVRRLGYAIGTWGGVEAIQDLQGQLGGVSGVDRPALQGAFLGALAARTH